MGHSAFRDIDAWRQARRLVKPVYEFSDRFPSDEKYILVAQMRKAVHSVHSNIAEGNGRLSNGEWQQFLGHARGSLLELESDVIAAFDLKYCTQEEASELTKLVKRVTMLVNGCLRKSAQGFPTKKYKPVNG